MTDVEYDRQHWVELIRTIIDRIGLEAFLVISDDLMEERMKAAIADIKKEAQ